MMSAKIAWPSLFSENLYIEDAHKYVGDAALFLPYRLWHNLAYWRVRIAYMRFTSALQVLF